MSQAITFVATKYKDEPTQVGVYRKDHVVYFKATGKDFHKDILKVKAENGKKRKK